MRHLLLSLSLLTACVGYAYQPAIAATTDGVARVVIQKRRTVIVRTGQLAKQFPDRKRAAITYPVVMGPKNSEVLRKVRALLNIENVFETPMKEYREEAWMVETDYEVNYNQNYILDITFRQETMGAYPDTGIKHLVINLRNGELIRAADVFDTSSFETLAALADKKLQAEIKEVIETSKEAKEDAESLFGDLKFKTANLDSFSVNDKGVTFLYDAGFNHATQALEPNGKFFFSYAELKSYIKRDGPLGIFVR